MPTPCVRFVNPQKHYQLYREEYLKTLDDVCGRGDYIMRQDLETFEQRIAEMVGVKHAIGVNSGTDALSLSFEALGYGPGDEVITVGHTFMASISAIAHCGATPVLIDVGEDFNINIELIEAAITPRTKAIEPVHLNGRMSDMEKIMEIVGKHKLTVVEDAAQALGSKIKLSDGSWKMAGSFGNTGCFSLYPFKILGCFGDGGILTTNDDTLAAKVRRLRFNGEDRETRNFYEHGYTALLDNVQAAILNVKLNYFPQWIARRRELAERYRNGLVDIPQIKTPHFDNPKFFDVYQNYVIRVEKRNDLVKYLNEQGVETLISWDTPMYKQPVMLPNSISLSETEKICQTVVSLPMYPEITNEEIDIVIEKIRSFYQ